MKIFRWHAQKSVPHQGSTEITGSYNLPQSTHYSTYFESAILKISGTLQCLILHSGI